MRLPTCVLVLATLTAVALPSFADPPGAPAAANEGDAAAREQARARYAEGVALVRNAQWSDALATFEAAEKLFPNASITLNIGACERALGRYVRARRTLERALAEAARSPGSLPDSSVEEARGFVGEIDRVLARVTLTVDPPSAAIAIDGRPLAPAARAGQPPQVSAGVLPPGPGKVVPARTFVVVLDPGAHVITLSRRGFADAVVNRTLAPGSSTTLTLSLDLLPATVKVTASQKGALVRVNDADVGPTPVDVLRPAGSYRVVVQRDGFVPYTTSVSVRPGEEVKLHAPLEVEKPTVWSRWWFWSGAAAIIAGGAVITYAVTRPEPTAPPYDGGSTGWVVHPTAVSF